MQQRSKRYFLRKLLLTAMAAVAWLGASLPASALPIEATVGSGPDLATVVIEFGNGAGFAFEVLFDDAVVTTGLDIMRTLEAELTSFVLTELDFGEFGIAIDGIAYDGNADVGFGGGENFWHYWNRDSDLDPWGFASVGASNRVVLDGYQDGWVYGSANPPLPEPSTAVLVGLGIVAAARRRAQSSR